MFPPIEELIEDYEELKKFLLETSQISLANNVENHLRKVMLLACASYYENEIQSIIREFTHNNTSDERVLCFVSNKAISRQYHTYFNWGGNNVNSFLALFGSEFKKEVAKEINDNQIMNECMRSFLTLGDERNKMVHENFLSYKLEKTFNELIILHNQATMFIVFLKQKFANTEDI